MYIDISNNKRICLNSGDATHAETADQATKADSLTNAYLINGVKFNGTSDIYFYGVCGTAAATAAKTVTLHNDSTGGSSKFMLKTGVTIAVKFSNTNTVKNPTLNVNGTGAKPIYQYGTVAASTSTASSWRAGAVVLLTYDGSGWIRHDWADSNTIPSAYCSTAAGTAAKTASCTGYTATAKTYLHLIITAANSVKSALTLNVNGKGGKPIYINGNATSSSNYTLPAGSYLTYYDGTNYHIRTDGKIPGSIEKADAFTSEKIITLTGDVEGAGSSTGANGWEIVTTVKDDSHNHSTYVQKAGDTMTGDLIINGSNGTKGWVVRRNNADSEAVKLTVDDSNATFTYTNDERSNNFKFVLNNTDTESSVDGTSVPSTSTVTFTGANNKSTVTADYFSGNGANLTGLNASKITAGILGTAQGGTGKGSWTPYGIVYASDKSTLAQLGIGSANQILMSQGAGKAPTWKTLSDVIDATYVNIKGDTMTGNLTAPKFIGELDGNAKTATRAETSTTADNAINAGYADDAGSANSAEYLKTSIAFTPAETALTPDNVYTLIGQYGRIKRGTWNYAGNGYIEKGNTATSQCPYGAIDLAGTTVIQAANNATQYTQIYITPPTASTTNAIKGEMLYYINNGSGYSPTWYRVLTDKNYSSFLTTNPNWKNIGSASQPIYFDNTGTPKAAHAYSTLLSNLSWNNRTLTVEVGGTSKTAAIPTTLSGFHQISFSESSTNKYTFSPTNQAIVINGISESTTIAEAPGIGFHIGSKSWGSLKFVHDGSFRFYNNDGSAYMTIYAKDVNASGALNVTGNSALAGTLGVTGNTTLNGTLKVAKAATLSNALSVTGATTLNSTLTVAETAVFKTPPVVRHKNNRYGYIYFQNNAGLQLGAIGHDIGNATTVQQSRFYFREWSAKATNDTGRTEFYETYYLPASTDGLTANKDYSILTSKNAVTTAQGGTGNTSFTANRLVWTETATKMTAGYHYASSTKVGINLTSEPSSTFHVNGSSYLDGAVTMGGTLTITHNTATNQKITTSAGALYVAPASTMYIASGSGSSIIFQPQGTEQARFNTSGQLQIKSTGAANATIIGPGTAGTFYFPNTGGTFVTHATRGTAVGSSTKPVYIASTGRATECGSSLAVSITGNAATATQADRAVSAGTATSAESATTATRISLNGIADSTKYGTYGGIIQDSSTGPNESAWHNSIKILHNNAEGYYTQLAQQFTGAHGLWHRSCRAGTISKWYHVLDSGNFNSYAPKLDGTGATGKWNINISGNAATADKAASAGHATTADTATKDSSGKVIKDTYVKKSGDTMSGDLNFPNTKGIVQAQGTGSNYTVPIKWDWADKSATVKHQPSIGHHSNGDTHGAIVLLPYAIETAASGSTQVNPWSANDGLYISKTRLRWNGNAHAVDKNPTLAWGTTSAVATIFGTQINVTMPANPNTDAKVKQGISTTGSWRSILTHHTETAKGTEPAAVTNQVYYTGKAQIQPSTGSLYLAGNLSAGGTATITGNTTLSGTLSVAKKATLSNDLAVTGSTSISGGLTVASTALFKGLVKIGESTQTATPAAGIAIHDLRDVTPTPGMFGEKRANFYFDQVDGRWASILHMHGWTASGYAAWELAGNSATDKNITTLKYRTGLDGSWTNWHKVLLADSSTGVLAQKLYFNADSLSENTTSSTGLDYVCGITGFASGGELQWKAINQLKVGYATKAGSASTADSATSAGTATTASKLTTSTAGGTTTPVYFSGGVPKACTMIKSGAWYGGLTYVGGDGVMEVGKYIDFHVNKTGTSDYDVRIDAATTGLTISGTTSGTFKGNLDGNASTANTAATAGQLTDINENDKASSSDTWRRLWFSYNNNTTGRPAYDDRFAIQTSTGTLKAPIFSGNLNGNAKTATNATNANYATSAGTATSATYLTSQGANKANTRTQAHTQAVVAGGWASNDAGYGSTYGTTLDVSGYSTWYHRLAFHTNGEIDYWQGINTNTLTKIGRLLTSANWTGIIDGRYVKKTGDSMSGTLSWGGNVSSLNLRTGHASYDGVISYQTSGNEAMLFTTKNAVTSFMFVNGEDTITNMAADRWTKLTPGLQIKNNCVAIGGLIANDASPTHKLWVNGTSKFSDDITLNNSNVNIVRAGISQSWYQGRNSAMIKTTSYTGYDSILSMKTTDGDWSLGVYTGNKLYFTYITDAHYNANNNTTTAQIRFDPNGTVVANTFSGSLNGHATSATTATTSYYPYGFTSYSTNATWGNQTGSTVVCWNEANGGSVDWRRDNPSAGKISLKVDGRFYGNEGAKPAMLMTSANGYWGLSDPDGTDTVWIRTTTQGIIPYQSGGRGSGHQTLGTSSWYFAGAYIDTIDTNTIYASNWFRSYGDTGLYNEKHKTHLMPNTVSNYAGWRVSGKRGDYHGILIGDATTSMAIMSIDNSHQGLYTQSGTGWIIYNNNANGCIALGGADIVSTSYKVTTNGSHFVNGSICTNGNINYYNGGNVKPAIRFQTGDTNGAGISIGAGGYVVIGSGESAANFVTDAALSGGSEQTYITSDGSIYFHTNCQTIGNRTTTCYINTSGRLYGAAWNDYAEFRECITTFEAGQVVCENGDDTLSLATERLQPGACIVSDTFGFAIGETDIADCPIAVSGRVLAYPYEPRESYKAGDPVCAGPGGTVSKMTREEVREYPDRMIGTVSAIPKYETWGQDNVPVNGRIWIKVV